jgi:hypothetical protein
MRVAPLHRNGVSAAIQPCVNGLFQQSAYAQAWVFQGNWWRIGAMRRIVALTSVSAVTAALALVVGVQMAPAADRGDLGGDGHGRGSLEFVGRADQNGLSIAIFGYVTHVAGLDDAEVFATANPLLRNETNARITFTAQTQVNQAFQVLPPPATSSLFDVDSAGTLTFYFVQTPSGRSFGAPASFATGTPIASYALRFQDVVAALVGVDPTRGVVDSSGQLCQQSVTAFQLAGQTHRLGHPGVQHSVFTHGWTVRTSPNPPQSFTHFGGHTDVLSDGRC